MIWVSRSAVGGSVSNDPQVVYRLEATSYDLSPEQETLALDAMAELTVRNSMLFAKRKAPEPASSHFSSTSFTTESQRKRSKLS
jgi:hypothetical protein